MSTKIIQDRFDQYHTGSRQEAENAMAEIAQEIALAGLSRSDFFKHAIFQGGTSLRILYGLQRFSEDLDFILKRPDSAFRLGRYFEGLMLEFKAYGIECTVEDRSNADATIQKAFIKSDSIGKILSFRHLQPAGRMKAVKIKFEVDINPPDGNGFETKYLDFPFPFPVIVQDPPSLFAGKSHALLCREYLKGRDWFDFAWYVGRKTRVNFVFLSNAIAQTGPWKGQGVTVDKEWYLKEMEKKIASVNWADACRDIIRFLTSKDAPIAQMWSQDYFAERLQKMREYL